MLGGGGGGLLSLFIVVVVFCFVLFVSFCNFSLVWGLVDIYFCALFLVLLLHACFVLL